jgi:hypothetical protein
MAVHPHRPTIAAAAAENGNTEFSQKRLLSMENPFGLSHQ